jgi:flavin reductase (DIM6/NTAB) family NADH-FMN oxidoreductase RutF
MDGASAGAVALDSFTPGQQTARAFRDALGRFATGVTVVTTDLGEGPVGITANSFASVSLDPPLILWSPARESSRFVVFSQATDFAVHVLGDDQRHVAAHFVRHGRDFGDFGLQRGPGGVPLLDDCLARFVCRRVAAHDGGDHLIIVGEVLEAAVRSGGPLVFSQGMYGKFIHGH